jgi:hypothetical protein
VSLLTLMIKAPQSKETSPRYQAPDQLDELGGENSTLAISVELDSRAAMIFFTCAWRVGRLRDPVRNAKPQPFFADVDEGIESREEARSIYGVETRAKIQRKCRLSRDSRAALRKQRTEENDMKPSTRAN